jgi:hypothetical protein
MAVDVLFPYPDAFPAPGDGPTGQFDRRQVRYPGGLFAQLPYRPFSPISHRRVVQAKTPPPRSPRPLTFCPECGAQEVFVPPALAQCNRCGGRQRKAGSAAGS